MERRALRLSKETLVELSSDELMAVVGATDDSCGTCLCNPCIFTWSCDDITLKGKIC